MLHLVPRAAAFHLQQAAEKLVLAVLEAEGLGSGPRSRQHQLGALAERLPAAHPFRADFASLDRITAYATQLRYPKPGGTIIEPPDPRELEGWLDEIDGLRDDVADYCRDLLSRADRSG